MENSKPITGQDISDGKEGVTLHSPRVSIIIPVYNGANFLDQSISSALAQTYGNAEVLVVDDGSDDNGATAKIATAFGDRIRYLTKPHGGIASALNYGISKMQGELFSWLSHDDTYTPDKIETEVAEFIRRGQKGIIYSDFYAMDKCSQRLHAHELPDIPPDGIRCFLLASDALNGCALLIPREYLLAEKGFDESLVTTQDYDMWFRLATRYPFYHVKQQLVGVRLHAGQATTRLRDQVEQDGDKLYCRFLSSLTETEIAAYSHKAVLPFYLKVYSRLNARDLPDSTRLAKEKCLQAIGKADNRFSALLRYYWVTLAWSRIVHLRVCIRYALFRNDGNYFAKCILSFAHILLGKKYSRTH